MVKAAVHGPAVGAGLDLALVGNVQRASSTLRMAMSQVKVGIVLGDDGSTSQAEGDLQVRKHRSAPASMCDSVVVSLTLLTGLSRRGR